MRKWWRKLFSEKQTAIFYIHQYKRFTGECAFFKKKKNIPAIQNNSNRHRLLHVHIRQNNSLTIFNWRLCNYRVLILKVQEVSAFFRLWKLSIYIYEIIIFILRPQSLFRLLFKQVEKVSFGSQIVQNHCFPLWTMQI